MKTFLITKTAGKNYIKYVEPAEVVKTMCALAKARLNKCCHTIMVNANSLDEVKMTYALCL